MTKTYSTKSNALRALKAQFPVLADGGESNGELADNYLYQPGDGGWAIHDGNVEDAIASLEDAEREDEREADNVVTEDDMEAEYDNDDGESPVVQPLRPIKGTGAYKDVPLRRRTTDGGAVSWAWSVFDGMPAGTSRKDAIAEAVRVGIAFYTARTQYQKWLHRNDPKPEAK